MIALKSWVSETISDLDDRVWTKISEYLIEIFNGDSFYSHSFSFCGMTKALVNHCREDYELVRIAHRKIDVEFSKDLN